jgi:hypothetical protein
MVIVKFWFDDALFDNTLFDGEMVGSSNNKWLFIINDIFADSGHDMNSQNLVKRLNRCYEICSKQLVQDEQDVCDIEIKRYFHYSDFETMVTTFQASLPYSCRGIYFKPLFLKFKDILYNFDESLVKKVVKKKYKGESAFLGADCLEGLESAMTVMDTLATTSSDDADSASGGSSGGSGSSGDVDADADAIPIKIPPRTMYLQKTNQPDIYEVFDGNNASVSKGVACVNNIKVSKMMKLGFETATPIDKIKFTCEYNAKFGKWSPVARI